MLINFEAASLAIKTRLSLIQQRILENRFVVHTALVALMVLGGICALVGLRRKATMILSQVHRTTRLRGMRRVVEPYIIANRDVTYVANAGERNKDISQYFGGRISVLKAPASGGEQGCPICDVH